jgi:2-methylisocitrate lyase-like PEP mutase family enzyme
MIIQGSQAIKADLFRNQHLSGKLLVLPNIWDSLGARLLQQAGYKSVATASVATALSNGYLDGERIPFMQLLKVVNQIVSAVPLPVTVDIERGFADSVIQLKENIRLLIENGAIGINIEDSHPDHQGLFSIAEQCRKIEGIREVGIQCGVPIVINARTDVFLQKNHENAMTKAIERGLAFKKAGADCFYPIVLNSYDEISHIIMEVEMPINVLLSKPVSDLEKLEKMGVARLSLGPNLLNHALATMKLVVDGLLRYDSTAFFSKELLPREFLNSLGGN